MAGWGRGEGMVPERRHEHVPYPSVNMPWNLLFLPRIPWISNKFAMDF